MTLTQTLTKTKTLTLTLTKTQTLTEIDKKKMRNFKKYDIWIDGMNLVDAVYSLVDGFPNTEKFALSSQITRSAVSVPSNIAEGASRSSEKDFARFLEIALGSSFELETHLIIASKS